MDPVIPETALATKATPDPSDFLHDIRQLDQHFLNGQAAERIVDAATITAQEVILDIGAGTGELTAAILRLTPARVIAVECDRRCLPYLHRLHRKHTNLAVLLERIQATQMATVADTTLIIANPPFSALDHLPRLLRDLPALQQAILCVSRRWAATVTADLRGSAYGATSIALQSRFDAAILDLIDGDCFTPAIRKPAALLRLIRLAQVNPAMDALGHVLLNQAGIRLKDFLRSRQLRRAVTPEQHRMLLHHPSLRKLQQRRLHTLSRPELSVFAALLDRPPN